MATIPRSKNVVTCGLRLENSVLLMLLPEEKICSGLSTSHVACMLVWNSHLLEGYVKCLCDYTNIYQLELSSIQYSVRKTPCQTGEYKEESEKDLAVEKVP